MDMERGWWMKGNAELGLNDIHSLAIMNGKFMMSPDCQGGAITY
jgi:hypothetical protein